MANKKPPPTEAPESLRHNPFAALAGRNAPAAASPSAEPHPPLSPAVPSTPRSLGRLVLRRETKHRGGKAVIVISGFDQVPSYDAAAIEGLAKRLKQALGCGGTVEGQARSAEIVLQGDRAAKVTELLRAEHFRVAGVTS